MPFRQPACSSCLGQSLGRRRLKKVVRSNPAWRIKADQRTIERSLQPIASASRTFDRKADVFHRLHLLPYRRARDAQAARQSFPRKNTTRSAVKNLEQLN